MSRKEKTQEIICKIYGYIDSYVRSNKYPPSVREISKALGIKSTASVYYYLEKMREQNLINKAPEKKRAIEIISPESHSHSFTEIPLVGKIAAGSPITAIENVEESIPLPTDMFGSGVMFMLTVSGDSMIEAGINDGDKIIVKQQNYAQNGEIVAAMIDNAATVKRFYREDGQIRLKPENQTMSDIIVKGGDFSILGVVKGLIRNY